MVMPGLGVLLFRGGRRGVRVLLLLLVLSLLCRVVLLVRAVLLREAAPGKREQDGESQEERRDERDASSSSPPPSPWLSFRVGHQRPKSPSVSSTALLVAAGASRERLYPSVLSLLLRAECAEREQRGALPPLSLALSNEIQKKKKSGQAAERKKLKKKKKQVAFHHEGMPFPLPFPPSARLS